MDADVGPPHDPYHEGWYDGYNDNFPECPYDESSIYYSEWWIGYREGSIEG